MLRGLLAAEKKILKAKTAAVKMSSVYEDLLSTIRGVSSFSDKNILPILNLP